MKVTASQKNSIQQSDLTNVFIGSKSEITFFLENMQSAADIIERLLLRGQYKNQAKILS